MDTSEAVGQWLVGGGEMGRLIRSKDWSATPLGPLASWPQSLRTALGICLNSRFPMFVWWRAEFLNLYNDAYAPMLGKRHPDALGRPARATWADIWDVVGPQADAVISRGEATWNERVLLVTERHGYAEQTWFTWSYSPVYDETGVIRGMFCAVTEETGRVRTEAALRDAERRYRAIFEATADGLMINGPDGRLKEVNPAACRMHGRTREELLATPPSQFVHPDDHHLFEQFLETTRRGEAFQCEARDLRKDGAVIPVEVRGTSFEYDGERHLLGVVRDITDRKHAEEQLRASEERFRSVLEHSLDAAYRRDLRADIYDYLSPVAGQVMGIDAGRMRGMGIDEFLERIHPDDRAHVRDGLAAEPPASGGRVEYRLRGDDGRYRWMADHYAVQANAAGEPIFRSGIVRDVTEQKRADQRINRLYTVAAALSEAVLPRDVARVTVDQGIAALGAAAGSLALLSENGSELEIVGSVGYPPGVIDRWQRFPIDAPIPLAEAARLGEAILIESGEERLARYPALASVTASNGTQASACIPLAIGGRTVGALGLSFDRPGSFSADDRAFMVSLCRQCAQALDRARLFEAEQRARAEAERAGRMKDEFLATLSHELRTPLNAILGWSQILTIGPANDDDLRHGLATIERNARAQAQIIEDLLDMSRIISGKIRLDVQRVDPAPVLIASLDAVRPAADAKGVRLDVSLAPQADGPIFGDPTRLQQVFWNLLSNAMKFTPKGGVVRVEMERAGGELQVSVADTGEGISPDFMPHVFDRFRQSDASTTRRHGGLGLGLSIVKQLVELHGGSVRASSPGPGRGATFTVTLPLPPVEDRMQRTPTDGRARQPMDDTRGSLGNAANLAGMRVLVVDDEADARALMKRVLEDRQARVSVASSAAEAFQLLRAERPDVLVSDIGMPQEDGFDLIRRVRALPHEAGGGTPAVALTAFAHAEDRVRAITAGFQHHAAKPVQPADLVRLIAEVVSNRAADARGSAPR